MTPTNPYQAPDASLSPAAADAGAPGEPLAIGGWLYLVAFGLIVTPFLMLRQLNENYRVLATDGAWTLLTTPGTAEYHPGWGPFLATETIVNIGLLGLWLALLVLFFRKHRRFPRWYAFAHVFSLVFQFADAWVATLISPETDMFGNGVGKEIVRSFIGTCIWVPYILLSERVKATFVR